MPGRDTSNSGTPPLGDDERAGRFVAFKDLAEFFQDDTLDLPINGTTYTFKSVDAETGLFLQHWLGLYAKAEAGGEITDADAGKVVLDDAAERSLFERLMGDELPAMEADGVNWARIQHVAKVLMAWANGIDRDRLEAIWEGRPLDAEGKGRPAPQDHKAAVSTTKTRASTSGTRAPRKAAAATRGVTS